RAVRRAVALLRFPGGPCTGFLIAPDLVITNFHCINLSDDFKRTRGSQDGCSGSTNGSKRPACQDVEGRFDYDGPSARGVTPPCLGVVRACEKHDFAVVRIDPSRVGSGGTARAPVHIAWDAQPPSTDAVVVGHPLGVGMSAGLGCKAYDGSG